MKIRALLLPTLAVIALSGCGQKGSSTGNGAGETSSSSASTMSSATSSSDMTASTASTTATASDTTNGARTIAITASDQMKFSTTSIEAKPGEKLHVTLTNTGSLPKAAMAHNWILLKPGSDVMAFATAAATSQDTGYIPDALKDEIIAHINLVGPHETGEVTFNAPSQPGEYPFLCSFPGHAAVGMHGILTVK